MPAAVVRAWPICYHGGAGGNMKKKTVWLAVLLVLSGSLFSYSSKLEEKLFYGMGHFGAAFLYQSYLNIGMVADAWTHNIYTPADSKTFLNGDLSFLETSRKLLQELSEFSITKEDRATFLEMIAIIENLKGEADNMLKYIAGRDQKDLDRYDHFRTQAWAQISKLMGIK
jgi:hypothetical protein